MRQAILTLVTLLVVVVHTALAQIFTDGDYRIYYGKTNVPRSHRFITAEPVHLHEGTVRTFPRNNSDLRQVWTLKNNAYGQVTLESKAAPGKYLGLRRSGANPGAYLGVVPHAVSYNITKKTGGSHTFYELAYPDPVRNQILIVSIANKHKQREPYYVNFGVQGTKGTMPGWNFDGV
ncbi:MAG: hypothetical protein J3Q66DRAFT_430907 [Benniella sp.]|nr:MAG: hypothetical protein J3Q66DRAFT_430907 [Benniella sp.]